MKITDENYFLMISVIYIFIVLSIEISEKKVIEMILTTLTLLSLIIVKWCKK